MEVVLVFYGRIGLARIPIMEATHFAAESVVLLKEVTMALLLSPTLPLLTRLAVCCHMSKGSYNIEKVDKHIT
jgi:hypothetical protein